MAFNTNFKCPICQRFHAIRTCSRFIVLPVEEKVRTVAQQGLCYNYLAQSHALKNCRSLDRCRRCQAKHNSLLHPMPENRIWVHMTARVKAQARHNQKPFILRALLDPSVERSLINRQEVEAWECHSSNGLTQLRFFNEDQTSSIQVKLKIVAYKLGVTPVADVEADVRLEPGCGAADRRYNKSRPYHMVLGRDILPRVLIGPAVGTAGMLNVQTTIFGFAYFGEAFRDEHHYVHLKD